MTSNRLLVGLLQPLLALLLLAGVPLPGGGPTPDARVAAFETLAKGLAAGRDRLGGLEIAAPDDPAGGDDAPARGAPALAAAGVPVDPPSPALAEPAPRAPPAPTHRACAGPPRGPPFA